MVRLAPLFLMAVAVIALATSMAAGGNKVTVRCRDGQGSASGARAHRPGDCRLIIIVPLGITGEAPIRYAWREHQAEPTFHIVRGD
jgi:hypothetical protein